MEKRIAPAAYIFRAYNDWGIKITKISKLSEEKELKLSKRLEKEQDNKNYNLSYYFETSDNILEETL